MKLKDMISTLRTVAYERMEIRDEAGNEILTCPTNATGWKVYQELEVTEWFPHGAPHKEATFTVYIKYPRRTCSNCQWCQTSDNPDDPEDTLVCANGECETCGRLLGTLSNPIEIENCGGFEEPL